MFKKLTPVLIVDSIEPLLPFWAELGFEKTVEVPHENRLGFVILRAAAAELMLQTVDSVRADEAGILEGRKTMGAGLLFIEVEDLDAVARRVPKTTDVIVQRRTTFYGSTEMIVRDAAGYAVIFAQMPS